MTNVLQVDTANFTADVDRRRIRAYQEHTRSRLDQITEDFLEYDNKLAELKRQVREQNKEDAARQYDRFLASGCNARAPDKAQQPSITHWVSRHRPCKPYTRQLQRAIAKRRHDAGRGRSVPGGQSIHSARTEPYTTAGSDTERMSFTESDEVQIAEANRVATESRAETTDADATAQGRGYLPQ